MCYIGVKAQIRRLWLLIFISGLLSACVMVTENWDPQGYTVKTGDTLYSIAWRYEKDFRDIARWNSISAPYHIYPGQRLRMNPDNLDGTVDHQAPQDIVIESAPVESAPEPPPVAATLPEPEPEPVPRPSEIVVAKGDTLYSLARDHELKVAQLARWNFIRQPYRIHPGQRLRLYPPGVSPPAVINESRPIVTPPKPAVGVPVPALPARVSQWAWPVSGKVIKTFSQHDTDRKGIGIAGHRGQAVKAAADGQVVYSGNGLISYGNLVIIKHSNAFLSAYAHNRKLLVKEGEQVRAGQDIANMGAAERGKAILHFEIRKNGKPVDPLRYLPRTRG